MSLKEKFIKYFKLPTPVELGMSKHNALGMRAITPFQRGYTWEDWKEKVKALHPVKYFILEIVRRKLSRIWHLIDHFFYYLKCHLIPKYKFHLIDLRNVDPCIPYKYGYLTVGLTMRYACWKALKDYINSKDNIDPRTLNFSADDQKESWFQELLLVHVESKALFYYWTVTRSIEKEVEDQLFEDQQKASKELNEHEYRRLGEEALNHSLDCQRRENEMFIRLAKISHLL